MNSPITRCLAVAAMISTSTLSSAYELVTHGLITNQAYNLSKLTQSPSLIVQLGFSGAQPPFSDVYFDFGSQTGNVVFARRAQPYEEIIMRRAGVRQPFSILGWIQRGAIREDDGGFLAAAKAGEPSDDPFGNFNRFCNHFLDPITRNPLSSTFLSDQLSFIGCPNGANTNAANWAMGAASGNNDAFSNTPTDANSRNHFSIFAAREAMWRALTLRRKDGTAAPRPDILYLVPTWTKEDDRKAYWATAFRAVGDMLHLNQDMAQPQHTRNEGHGLVHAAIYEKYVDARAQQLTQFQFDGEGRLLQEVGQLPILPVATSYPTPRFNRYSDYWSDAQGAASISGGRGLADYSSRGFFTPAKNLGNAYAGFPNPPNNVSAYSIVTALGNCTSSPGRAQYATGNLPDDFLAANDPSIMVKYASRSLVDGQWSLNRCVFEERVNLLIPRAVAYSAGLIDYFFRGQLEIRPPEEGVYAILDHSITADNCKDTCGFKKIKLKVANSTPDIVPSGGGAVAPQIMSGGTLVAVAKYHKNTCYTTDLEGEYDSRSGETISAYVQRCRSPEEEISVSQPLANQSPVACNANLAGDCDTKLQGISNTLTFNFTTPIPINATDLYLQVVYRGPLGSEQDAVVVATKDIAEPTYFSIVNVSDYLICYNNSWVFKDSNGNLPASIPTIVDGKLATELYKASNYNFWRITLQPAQDTTLARVDTVQPKEYARVAVLVEPGQSYNHEINGYVPPEPPPFRLVTAGLNQSGFTAAGSPTSTLFDYKASSFRKVKAHASLMGYTPNRQDTTGICLGLALPDTEPGYPPYTKPTVMREVTISFP